LGLCPQEEPSRIRAHLAEMGMKCDLVDIEGDLPDADALVALMAQDKKVLEGQLRFILMRGIGTSFVTSAVPSNSVKTILNEGLGARS
jgi:3-dehydroquinate synthase